MQYKLTAPVTREDLAPLRAGDTVLLPGPPPAAGWTPTPPACWTWARR